MNRVLVNVYLLLFSLPLFFSCGRGQQSSLSSLQNRTIRWAEQRMEESQLSTYMDSAYWIGICWNIYQLSKDSIFRIEAEKYLLVQEDSDFNANKAFRVYMAFGKGFDATGIPRYRGKVWDLADYLLADTSCINASTVEAMLWGTAHEGCHCFKEGAINWGERQLESATASVDALQALGILYAYTSGAVYRDAFEAMNQSYLLQNAVDSLRLASVYTRIDSLLPESGYRDEAVSILKESSLNDFTSLQGAYYFTESLLRLSAHKKLRIK